MRSTRFCRLSERSISTRKSCGSSVQPGPCVLVEGFSSLIFWSACFPSQVLINHLLLFTWQLLDLLNDFGRAHCLFNLIAAPRGRKRPANTVIGAFAKIIPERMMAGDDGGMSEV